MIFFFVLYVGTDCIKKRTLFLYAPISKKYTSYRFEISKHISFNVSSTAFKNTTSLYFVRPTKWNIKTDTLFDLLIYSISAILQS